jgi:hypothetical protein
MRRTLTLRSLVLAAAMACGPLAGCGGSTTNGSHPDAALAERGASLAGDRAPGFLTGDYDRDDIEGSRYADADNDESTNGKDADNDRDAGHTARFDSDDGIAIGFGRPADARDAGAVALAVKRYYAAASTQDGARACAVMTPSEAAGVAQDLGRPPGASYYRGETCAAVMGKVFAVNRPQLLAHARTLIGVKARVGGRYATAVLSFRGLPARQLRLARVHGGWMVAELVDRELP